MPPYAGSSLDDFYSLMSIVEWMQPRIVLELGTALGNTVANVCRLIPTTQVYTVNAPADEQSGILTTHELSVEQIGWVYRKYGYGSRVTQILQNTLQLDLSKKFSRSVIDLAIVDACHDTTYVVNDFLKVQPFIRRGGLVLLHDTHPSMSRHYYGSYRACMLLRGQGYDIRHLTDTSWAMWSNGLPQVST
jgi:predicted O-methyltransferase YrrM